MEVSHSHTVRLGYISQLYVKYSIDGVNMGNNPVLAATSKRTICIINRRFGNGIVGIGAGKINCIAPDPMTWEREGILDMDPHLELTLAVSACFKAFISEAFIS